MNIDEKVIILLFKVSVFLLGIGLVFGAIVPTMISQANSVIVLFGLMMLMFGGLYSFKIGSDIFTEAKEILKGDK